MKLSKWNLVSFPGYGKEASHFQLCLVWLNLTFQLVTTHGHCWAVCWTLSLGAGADCPCGRPMFCHFQSESWSCDPYSELCFSLYFTCWPFLGKLTASQFMSWGRKTGFKVKTCGCFLLWIYLQNLVCNVLWKSNWTGLITSAEKWNLFWAFPHWLPCQTWQFFFQVTYLVFAVKEVVQRAFESAWVSVYLSHWYQFRAALSQSGIIIWHHLILSGLECRE